MAKHRFKAMGLVLAMLLVALLAPLAAARPASAETLGYPHTDVACSHAPYAVTGTCAGYDWGPVRDGAPSTTYSSRGYGYRNCTDYVAWKLQSLGVADSKTRNLHNGGQWADYAANNGLSWSTTPKAGTAAVKPGNPGHVAFVEMVYADGSIAVSEFNRLGTGEGSTWTGMPASRGFTKFVDFGVVVMPQPPATFTARSDIDKNGGADLVIVTAESNGSAHGFSLLSTYQSFISPQLWWDGSQFGWSGITPLVGDVNGDKRADLVYLTNEANGTKAFVATAGVGGFNPPQLWWDGTGWGYAGIKASLGDADGNGGEDLVLTTGHTGGSAAHVLLSAYGTFLPPHLWWDGGGYGWSGITPIVGDVNGDKKADYIYLTDEGAGGTKAFVATAGSGGFNPAQLWWDGAGWGYSGIKLSLGDADGNGGADLVLTTRESNGAANGFVMLSTYDTFLAPQLWWDGSQFGWSGITPLVGDINGDRKADYVYLTDEGAAGTKAFVATAGSGGFNPAQMWWNGVGWGYNGIKAYLK